MSTHPLGQTRNGTYSPQIACWDLAPKRAIFANVDLESLIEAASKPQGAVGPRQSDRGPMPIVRAHSLSFSYPSNVENVTALREAAGFDGSLPSRSTLSRAFRDMARFHEPVESTAAELVREIKNRIPVLGREIAAYSTPVKSRSNPNFQPPSVLDAVRIRHDRAGAKSGIKWEWGYFLQLAVDANHDVPMWLRLSHENSDSRQIIPLLDSMDENLGGLLPDVVLADRGYASVEDSVRLHECGIEQVISKRTLKVSPKTGERLHSGRYATHGVSACADVTPMGYVGETDGRYLDCCSAAGDGVEREQAKEPNESTKVRGGVEDGPGACRDDVAVDPEANARLFGGGRRWMGSEWRRLYRKRWSVERVFSLWKGIGRLNAHRFRDHLSIALHVRPQMLAHLETPCTVILGARS